MKGFNFMKKNYLIIIIVGLIIASMILIAVIQSNKSSKVNMEPVEEQSLIYHGDPEADNEMLFLFDYACYWCALWMNDIYPTIESKYIDPGEVKFRTQAMVYVNDASLRLADLDQNIKKYAEDQYHQIFQEIIADSQNEDLEWGSDQYISDLLNNYQLDQDLILSEPDFYSIKLSRAYTSALGVEVVPTLYINGVKVEDPFNLDDIEALIK